MIDTVMRIARLTLIFVPALALAACGGGDSNSSAPAAPVAAVAPPQGTQWKDVVSKTPEGGFRMGNPDAPIKLIEYGSRTCPGCGQFGRTGMQPLEKDYVSTGKVSYEFRDYLIHAPDLGVAVLGRCAGAGPYFALLEQMYTEQEGFLVKLESTPADFQQSVQGMTPGQAASAWVDYLGYIQFVKQRGVSEQKARACLADPKQMDEVVNLTKTAADDLNVTSTPSFIVNGRLLENTLSWPQLETALKAAGA